MRRILGFLLAVLLCAGLGTAAAQTQEAPGAPLFPAPFLITSAGQSADAEMVKVMMTRLKRSDFSLLNLAGPEDLEGVGTLIIAIGGSSKGLGAAGIDADQELERVGALITAAQEKGIGIIALHIGGIARRGDLSDRFIAPCVSAADACIVVAEANSDGLFDALAQEHGVPVQYAGKLAEVIAPLGELLQ